MADSSIINTSNQPTTKSVGDPNSQYMSMRTSWGRARAIMGGQNRTKAYDETVNVATNILLPFSPSMEQPQYDFYKAEAELPGLVSQYAAILVGGLLRKAPQLELPDSVPPDAKEWIINSFGDEGESMLSFLDKALWEELQTTRAVVMVDYPTFTKEEYARLSADEIKDILPYAILYKAEHVINWRTQYSRKLKKRVPTKFTVRFDEEVYNTNDHHPTIMDTVIDYYLNEEGNLVFDKYQSNKTKVIKVINGETKPDYQQENSANTWVKIGETRAVIKNNKPMNFIPAFPLNGQWEIQDIILEPLIEREIGLYNKVSRRNHLLYGAATYTPVVASDIADEKFDAIVDSGLGSWIHVEKGGTVTALETPTAALKDMESAISNTIEEMARMGIRMLSPEGGAESGVALEIRNAAQTAQLGLLNVKVSKTMQRIIQLMIDWKYDIAVDINDIDYTLSADFNPVPMGADWMRLITEWYEKGIIPRSIFISIAKQNDVIPTDYDDDDGVDEIQSDPLINLTTGIDSGNVSEVVDNNPMDTKNKGVTQPSNPSGNLSVGLTGDPIINKKKPKG